MKKYELIEECETMGDGAKVYRIKALINFANVKKGGIGGFVEHEGNLSHHGCAWVYGNAKVYGNAMVYGNAKVSEDAQVYGNAEVYGDAQVYGNAEVYGDAQVCEYNNVSYGTLTRDISNNSNVLASLLCGLNVTPKLNKVTLYKRVNTDKKSGRMFDLHTGEFEYIVGKLAICKNAVDGVESFAAGLHVSTPDYWDSGNTLIQCEVNVKDIITVQDGKVRCRKLKVIAVVNKQT